MTELTILFKSACELTNFDFSSLGYKISFTTDEYNSAIGYWTVTSPTGKLSGNTCDGVITSLVPAWCEGERCAMLQEIDKHVKLEIISFDDWACQPDFKDAHEEEAYFIDCVDKWRKRLHLPQLDREDVDNG